jgi:hypothetical protein
LAGLGADVAEEREVPPSARQRKEKRGLIEADQHARREFTKILYRVINPAGRADSMVETTPWLKG